MKVKIVSQIMVIVLFFSLSIPLNSQESFGVTHSGRSTKQAPFPLYGYNELENPIPTDIASWKGISGINVAWGSIYSHYKKESYSALKSKKQEITGWKGERVAAQLVISSPMDIEKLSIEFTPPTHSLGKATISADQITKGFVRFVMTDELNKEQVGTCGARPNLSLFDSTLVADPIDHLTKYIPMNAKTTQSYWIGIWIPQDAKSGNYYSEVSVKDGDKVIEKVKLNIKVTDRTLPQPSEWAFHLDLWQNPYAVARYHKLTPWSKEHFDILKTEMQPYADAGGKVITVPIMHHPWGGQTYDPFETMITWVKRIDGTWMFDYTIFDRWVSLMMKLGVTKEIGCYSMIPWKLSFQYFDQATNSLKELKTKPGEQEYHDLWLNMLTDFAAHLKTKGWFNITHIAMDERPAKAMQESLKIIHKADPNFKVSLAGALHEELLEDLNDYSIAITGKYTEETKLQRKKEGKVTTFYTCCAESYPNTYTFSEPAEGAWLGWYTAKENLDGYLRWALNSWTIEPLLDSRFYTWGAGDTYLLYPGGRSSLRFENLIHGIQAYEKVRILRSEFTEKKKTSSLQELNNMLQKFDETKLPQIPASKTVEEANRLINKY